MTRNILFILVLISILSLSVNVISATEINDTISGEILTQENDVLPEFMEIDNVDELSSDEKMISGDCPISVSDN